MLARAFFDGGARNNPTGPAASAAIVISEDGETLFKDAQHIGIASNNVAEYRAAILAMQGALDAGVTHLLIYGDSQLIINQIFGSWNVGPELASLRAEAKALADRFEQIVGEYIPRAQNAVCNAMCNDVLDPRPEEVNRAPERITLTFSVEMRVNAAKYDNGSTRSALRKEILELISRAYPLAAVSVTRL